AGAFGLSFLVERRETAQVLDGAREDFERVGDLLIGRVLAEAEAYGAAREFVVATERAYDGRGFERAGRAGRAGRDGDALHVEVDEKSLALDESERDVRDVRETPRAVAVED